MVRAERVNEAMGDPAKVRTLLPRTTIEIRDIDPIVTKEKIIKNLTKHYKALKSSAVEVRALRGGYSGTSVTILDIPSRLFLVMKGGDKVKISYTDYKMWIVPSNTFQTLCRVSDVRISAT